jgi:hypothetical protein
MANRDRGNFSDQSGVRANLFGCGVDGNSALVSLGATQTADWDVVSRFTAA